MATQPNAFSRAPVGQLSLEEDRVLWSSIRKGNELAFSALFKKYVSPLFNYGMHFYTDADLVKDCIQDVYASLWQKRESLAQVDHVRAYLFKSFRNLLFLKVSQKKREVQQDFWEETYSDLEGSFEQEQIDRESSEMGSRLITGAIGSLTKRQREAVLLKYYNGLAYPQIAQIMGISSEAVQNLISGAIRSLRQKISR